MKTWLKLVFGIVLAILLVILVAWGDYVDYIYPNRFIFIIVLILLAFFFEWITKKW